MKRLRGTCKGCKCAAKKENGEYECMGSDRFRRMKQPPKEKDNFCADCNWYEAEEMYCFKQGHSYDAGNCFLWEPKAEPPKEEV